MRARRRAAAAAQHVLVGHELAVVFAERAFERPVARDRASSADDVHSQTSPYHCASCGACGGPRMVAAGFDEVAFDRLAARRGFPFGLGRQPRFAPARVGVGFVVAHVAHRRRGLERPQARQRHLVPRAVDLRPVERRLPRALLHRGPAVREPQLGPRVTAAFDEFEVFAVGHRARGEAVVAQEHLVARLLVVEAERAAAPWPISRMPPGNSSQRSGGASPLAAAARFGVHRDRAGSRRSCA